MPHPTPASLVTRDGTHRAGVAIRAIATADRRHRRDTWLIRGACLIATAIWVYVFREMFWGTAPTAMMLLIATAAVLTGGVLVKRARGIALAVTAAAGAIAATITLGRVTDLNWGFQLGGTCLIIATTAAALLARRHRFPRTAAALIGAWIVPAIYTTAPVIGGWVLLAAAAATTVAVCYQSERTHQLKVLRAARSNGIPFAAPSVFSAAPLTTVASGVDSYTLHGRAEASQLTAHLLDELPTDWYVFHSRISPAGDIIDHVVVGPPGVFVLRSELLAAQLRIGPHPDIPDLLTWDIDGAPADDEVAALLCDIAAQIDGALLTPNGVRTVQAIIVAHAAQMTPQHGPQSIIVDDGRLDSAEWVAPAALVDYLQQRQSLGRSAEFVDTLAAVVDHTLPTIG